MYFPQQQDDRIALVSAFSDDGLNWTPEPGIRLDPGPGGRLASPSLVQTEGGHLRIYCDYSSKEQQLGGICSAICKRQAP